MTVLGFLGFGEAASFLAEGIAAAGGTGMLAYDIAQESSPLVRERAARTGTTLVGGPLDLARTADVVVSAVVCTQAGAAVDSILEGLTPRTFVLDINSVSPGVKVRNAAAVEARGASYIDVAVMANASADFARLPMLAAGVRATEAASLLAPAEARVTVVSAVPGDAARIKMFRSALVKGVEALALEAMMACYPSGMHETVLASFEDTFGHYSFSELVKHLIGRHAVHGARRGDELVQVADALREVGVDPYMAGAGAQRMHWDVQRGLQAEFQGGEDPDWIDVLERLDQLRRAQDSAPSTARESSAVR
jgi:3-hydroxyisobutyrate dehydrogenase-like beta-hydroxyacid dehydrogenase